MSNTTTPIRLSLPARSLAAVAAGSIALAAHAETITVCLDGSCDFTDPAAAVSAAATGDTVQIAAGTYPLAATILIYGKNLTLRGAVDAQGRPATVLSGQGARSVLNVLSVSNLTRFENLVVTNGRSDYGGGVFLRDADPVFRNCRFTNNTARWGGGAMLLNPPSSPTLIDCELTGNSAIPGTVSYLTNGTLFSDNPMLRKVTDGTSKTIALAEAYCRALASGATVVSQYSRRTGASAPTFAHPESTTAAPLGRGNRPARSIAFGQPGAWSARFNAQAANAMADVDGARDREGRW
jgi:hypothetical protein